MRPIITAVTLSIPTARKITRHLCVTALLVVFAVCWLPAPSRAQSTTNATNGQTPLALTPGTPDGSYELSGFENVNLYNGSLNFHLPLLSIGGRGGAKHTVMLAIEQKWTEDHYADPNGGNTTDVPNGNWWDVVRPGYGPGVLQSRNVGLTAASCRRTATLVDYLYTRTQTRLTFTSGDGSEYELVDTPTAGAQHFTTPCATAPYSRGRTFVARDGSGATFISDSDVTDMLYASSPMVTDAYTGRALSGYLLLKDGTRYRIDYGLVSWIRDRQGNVITFTNDGFSRMLSATDALNRQVTILYDVNDGAPYGVCDRITFKGFGGATRTLRVSKTALGSALKAGYALQTDQQLFGLNPTSTATENPTVISAVWLPPGDGINRHYQFYYNSYAELARVELPTGGAYEYTVSPGLSSGGSIGGTFYNSTTSTYYIYRRLTERKVFADGTNLTNRTTYSVPERCTDATCGSTQTLGYVTQETFDAGAIRLARSQHYFYSNAAASFYYGPLGAPGNTDGKEYQSDIYDTNATTLLRHVVNTWAGAGVLGAGPHITETDTTLTDTNQVSKRTFAYDNFDNQTDVYDYDFGTGTPGGLVRRAHTDYLTTNPVNGADYTGTSIYIRNLPSQTSVYDAGGTLRAQTSFEYDNYSAAAGHAALTDRLYAEHTKIPT